MKTTMFEGVGTALVTPFNKDGSVDFEGLTKLLEFQIENKADAVIICGTTGEASTMPDKEHISVVEHSIKVVNKRIPVIAGAGSNDTVHGAELAKEMQNIGADGLLLVTPYYNKTSKKGLYKHYEATVKDINIPVCLYNVPGRTGLNIDLGVLKELAQIDCIVAIKEASGNVSYAMKIAADIPELDIYSGNDDIIVPILSLGGKGVISVVSNILPKETHDICEYYFKGEVEKSRALQLKMLELINNLFIEVNPIPVKEAMNMMGLPSGMLRLPLCEMEDGNREILKKSMERYGIKLQ